MINRCIAILFSTLVLSFSVHAQEAVQERPDWKKFFDKVKAKGTIVVQDDRKKNSTPCVFDLERANKRFSPASTYKIPHTLFALDSGAVRDEFQVFPWDGVQRAFAGAETIPQPTSQLVKMALAYIQQHYARTLSRAEIAATVGVSEDYLSRIFAKETGVSPWEYLNRYRVQQAKRVLRETQKNVTWIAAQVGFEDPAYFSRVFQRIVGCSPREYRTRAET